MLIRSMKDNSIYIQTINTLLQRSSPTIGPCTRIQVHAKKLGTQTDRKDVEKVIWFNPPYNNTVSTNVGKCFLNMIYKETFPAWAQIP